MVTMVPLDPMVVLEQEGKREAQEIEEHLDSMYGYNNLLIHMIMYQYFYTGTTWFWWISRTTWTKSESSTVLCIAVGIAFYSLIFYLDYQQGPTGAPGDPGEPGDPGTPVSFSIACTTLHNVTTKGVFFTFNMVHIYRVKKVLLAVMVRMVYLVLLGSLEPLESLELLGQLEIRYT